ncbi:MAG: class I SAM-dependent methyltransferase [Pseudomonadota bacterium]
MNYLGQRKVDPPAEMQQAEQYRFPYHYIPDYDQNGAGMRYTAMTWGLEYLCYQEHIQRLVEKLSPDSVLDVGCGDGRFIGRLDKRIRRFGVDRDERAIKFAMAFNGDVEFKCGVLADVDGIFDISVAIEVLEHVSDEAVPPFIQGLFSKVRSGGHVIISVPSTVLRQNSKHYRHYTEALIHTQLNDSSVKYEICSLERVYREPLWLKAYLRATLNRYWMFEMNIVRKLVWDYMWKTCRIADARTGHHIVAVLRKP